MTALTFGPPVVAAVRRLAASHNLAPVTTQLAGDSIAVHVRNLDALEVFADAVEKPLVEHNSCFFVAHEVGGVPTTFWSKA